MSMGDSSSVGPPSSAATSDDNTQRSRSKKRSEIARLGGGPDRRALNVLLAALEVEQRELAELTGYSPGYIANVLNGLTPVSQAFRGAFGHALAELLLGSEDPRPRRYPAGPLAEVVKRRAAQVARKSDLYADLGVSPHSLANRELVPEELVDRVCCALGVHLDVVYGPNGDGAS